MLNSYEQNIGNFEHRFGGVVGLDLFIKGEYFGLQRVADSTDEYIIYRNQLPALLTVIIRMATLLY